MLLSACVMSHSQCLPSPGCTQDLQSTQPTSSTRQGMYTNLYQNRLRGAVRCKPAYMVCAKYCQSRKWNIGHTHKSTWLEYFGSTELQSLLRKGFASGFCKMKSSLLYKNFVLWEPDDRQFSYIWKISLDNSSFVNLHFLNISSQHTIFQ